MDLDKKEFREVAEQCKELLGYKAITQKYLFRADIVTERTVTNPKTAELRYIPEDEILRFTHYSSEGEDVSDKIFTSTEDLYDFVKLERENW